MGGELVRTPLAAGTVFEVSAGMFIYSLEGVFLVIIAITLNNLYKRPINFTILIYIIGTPASLKMCRSSYCLNHFKYLSVIYEY